MFGSRQIVSYKELHFKIYFNDSGLLIGSLDDKGTIEMDFFVRDADSLVPVEVKAMDGATPSLNKLIENDKFADIKYGTFFKRKEADLIVPLWMI